MSKKNSFALAALTAIATLGAAPAVSAQAAGDLMVRGRLVNIAPANQDTIAALDVSVSSKVIPEVDFTYFLSPNLAAELILELAASAPGTLVVVDELYEAFTGDSVLPLADFAATPNLLVLRSLAKTAGLAGLRIGFAIGAAPVVDRLARVTGPYDINSFAVTAAHAALADQAYVDSYVAEVLRARTWLVQQLQAAGVRHHAEGGNYLLIWPELPAEAVEQRLRQAGILVRSMAAKPLIDGSLRVSLGTTEQMQRFWAAYLKAN